MAEFAKSLLLRGDVVSTLPWGLMSLNKKYLYVDAVLLFWHCCERGWRDSLKTTISKLPKGAACEEVFLALNYPGYA